MLWLWVTIFAIFCLGTTKAQVTLVKCIKVGELNFGDWTMVEPIKTCYMDVQTTIDSKGYSINERLANATYGLYMNYNKDIVYLPESVPDVFPYLLAYSAANCAIEEIYKENFDGLEHVKFLNLAGNKIEEIVSNTFRSLVSLERLAMDNNQIKIMDGTVFAPTKSLVNVWLRNNQCIDENLVTEEAISKVMEIIDDFCGILYKRDVKNMITEIKKEMENLIQQNSENTLKEIKGELEKLNNKKN